MKCPEIILITPIFLLCATEKVQGPVSNDSQILSGRWTRSFDFGIPRVTSEL